MSGFGGDPRGRFNRDLEQHRQDEDKMTLQAMGRLPHNSLSPEQEEARDKVLERMERDDWTEI
jgi:hypothetical protein